MCVLALPHFHGMGRSLAVDLWVSQTNGSGGLLLWLFTTHTGDMAQGCLTHRCVEFYTAALEIMPIARVDSISKRSRMWALADIEGRSPD